MRKVISISIVCFLFSAFCILSPSQAEEEAQTTYTKFLPSGPMNIRNQMPLYIFFMAPTPDKAQTLKKGRIEVDTSYHVSNTIIRQRPWPAQQFTPSDSDANIEKNREWWVYIDTEVDRFDLNLAYGVSDNLELSLDIPYFFFSGGYLDGFIENFENSFSFIKTPNAREEAGRYKYEYEIRNRGNPVILSTSEPNSFGEISAYLKYKFFNETKWLPTTSLRGAVKFPTARDSLLGSKKFDYSAGVLLDKRLFERFSLYCNFNWVLLEKPDILSNLDVFKRQMFHGIVGAEYFFTDKTSMLFQATANTTVYDGGIPCTARDPVVLTLGFNHNFNDKISWQVAMDENTNSAAPYFGLFTSLKIKI
jgi:hypothetical protein